jgi:tRNA (uracil-5-)-methyltransferase
MSNVLFSFLIPTLRLTLSPVIALRSQRIPSYHLRHRSPQNAHFSTAPMPRSDDSPQLDVRKRKKLKLGKSKSDGFDKVLQLDIDRLRHQTRGEKNDGIEEQPLPALFTEIQLDVLELSSSGDGLALSENHDHVYIVPFSAPGDKVLVKVVKHFPNQSYSTTDFLKVIHPGPKRDDAGINCQYFGRCSGCQLQMLPYDEQLAFKKRVVEKAYANLSGLVPELIPAVGDTFPSPQQYGYRTKLTPHFSVPGGGGRGKHRNNNPPPTQVPPIGFTVKNRRIDLDIEDCPLGTDIVRRGLERERKRVAENLHLFPRGATLLLRESTTRIKKDTSHEEPNEVEINTSTPPPVSLEDVIRIEYPGYIEEKRCITDNNAMSVEYVDSFVFSNKAGAFFQNNNRILSGFTEYIRQQAQPKAEAPGQKLIQYLLDAYSGSGLFTVTLSTIFKSSLGIDIAGESISAARENARANNLLNTSFAAADAAVLFKDVPFPPDQTLLLIDPPRKGCSDDFLRQLLDFGPQRVIYVSCNVHTQARDVGVLVQGDSEGKCRYEIESIRGFDFFPQTSHVEGVAVLNKASSIR